jgi:hypothetical protein
MSQPRDDRQDDLFRPPLNEIINLRHPLVRLAGEIDWDFLAGRFSSVCGVGPGQPPLPTRLVGPRWSASAVARCGRHTSSVARSQLPRRSLRRGGQFVLHAKALHGNP